MDLNTPVVFIIFNRPDLTQVSFDAIRRARPKQLLVVADGPRSEEESRKCELARSVIEQVDWDCKVRKNYSDKNLGCGIRISTGLNWVFSEVEEAIILEDDCLPAPSFFYFCQELLRYYRDDERVMHIGGNNFQNGQTRTPYSYYFSRYTHSWGWASWRRAWKYFDRDVSSWNEFRSSKLVDYLFDDSYEKWYWVSIFDQILKGAPDVWCYYWFYSCLFQSGLSIVPSENLVSNIGFREDGTHTTINSPFSNLPVNNIWVVRHPPFVIRDVAADHYTFDHVFDGLKMKEADMLHSKMVRIMSQALAKLKKLKHKAQQAISSSLIGG